MGVRTQTQQRTRSFSITKTRWLIVFSEVICC